jgi:hypothetical protein
MGKLDKPRMFDSPDHAFRQPPMRSRNALEKGQKDPITAQALCRADGSVDVFINKINKLSGLRCTNCAPMFALSFVFVPAIKRLGEGDDTPYRRGNSVPPSGRS